MVTAGRAAQQGTNNQGCFWSALGITLFQTGDGEVSKKNLLCLILNNVEKLVSSRKVRGSLGCSDDEMRMGQGNW